MAPWILGRGCVEASWHRARPFDQSKTTAAPYMVTSTRCPFRALSCFNFFERFQNSADIKFLTGQIGVLMGSDVMSMRLGSVSRGSTSHASTVSTG